MEDIMDNKNYNREHQLRTYDLNFHPNFENSSNGDKCWHVKHGWCKLIKDAGYDAIQIEDYDDEYFSFEGKEDDDDKYPSLFNSLSQYVEFVNHI